MKCPQCDGRLRKVERSVDLWKCEQCKVLMSGGLVSHPWRCIHHDWEERDDETT